MGSCITLVRRRIVATPKVVIPSDYKKKLMEEYHAEVMSGHFSGPRQCHVNGGGNIGIKTLSTILTIVHSAPDRLV